MNSQFTRISLTVLNRNNSIIMQLYRIEEHENQQKLFAQR